MSLRLEHLSVHAGSFQLKDLELVIPAGSCGVVMGRSGVGKTTLMEAICGLRRVDAGSILLHDQQIHDLTPGRRNIGLVPQDTVMFPHLTVREQLAFGPRERGWNKPEIITRVTQLAEALGIAALLDRRPQGLSGGEAKRVAIGRAIASRPALLCMDESLTGLDGSTHEGIVSLLNTMMQRESLTTLFITHREDEAQALGDQIHVLEDGAFRIRESG